MNTNKYAEYVMFRTFPHSNSLRRDVTTYDDDIQEMTEKGIPADAMPKLRKGKHASPSLYDDVFAERAVQKYTPKPKGTRHRDRDSSGLRRISARIRTG